MIRFKIVSGSLELSKGGIRIFVVGKLSVACNVLSLYEVIPMVSLYNLNQGVTTVVFTGKLSDCEDSLGVPFTVDTFITFVETNLGVAVVTPTPTTFIFTQDIPTPVWVIIHNLNKYPSVTVVDTAGTEVEGQVEYIDSNTIIITFSVGFAGKAYLN